MVDVVDHLAKADRQLYFTLELFEAKAVRQDTVST